MDVKVNDVKINLNKFKQKLNFIHGASDFLVKRFPFQSLQQQRKRGSRWLVLFQRQRERRKNIEKKTDDGQTPTTWESSSPLIRSVTEPVTVQRATVFHSFAFAFFSPMAAPIGTWTESTAAIGLRSSQRGGWEIVATFKLSSALSTGLAGLKISTDVLNIRVGQLTKFHSNISDSFP